jgi:predicted transcriptional regulator
MIKVFYVYIHIHMYMAALTTIRVSHKTKEILDTLKHHPRESYEVVIERLATMAHDDEPLSDEEIEDMKASLDDIRAGRVKTLKAVRAELGV